MRESLPWDYPALPEGTQHPLLVSGHLEEEMEEEEEKANPGFGEVPREEYARISYNYGRLVGGGPT